MCSGLNTLNMGFNDRPAVTGACEGDCEADHFLNNNGMWRSLVSRQFWELEIVGSNPAIPTV